jgi:hypothetical protein
MMMLPFDGIFGSWPLQKKSYKLAPQRHQIRARSTLLAIKIVSATIVMCVRIGRMRTTIVTQVM